MKAQVNVKDGTHFRQKDLSRKLLRGDRYQLWRRYDNGETTYLAVIWHSNWAPRNLGSGCSMNPDEVEQWTIDTLKRIHYDQDIINVIETDFKLMTSNDFFFSDDSPATYIDADLYRSIGGNGEDPIYLGDGVYMRPDGSTF